MSSCYSNPLRPHEDTGAFTKESEDVDVELDGDEGIPESYIPRIKKGPREPSAQERRNHEILHIPYRSWCKDCVRARAASSSHFSTGDRDKCFAGFILIIGICGIKRVKRV